MDPAALIKQARREARVTQQELALRVGRSRASIAQLEAGVRTPSIGSLRAILAALGKQVRVELEPLDADVRREMVEHRHDPELAAKVWFADTDRSTDWLARKLRHDRIRLRPESWMGPAFPRTPQEARELIEAECPGGWIMVRGFFHEIPVRFAPADVVARRVLVDNGGRPLPVQPLHEIDTTDRHAARVLRLLREQAQDTHG
jgi:transcriptional regulator with XRE-family HTH domain